MNIVKICGLKTIQEIKWTTEAGADLGGIVVLYPKSKRNLEITEAEKLVSFVKEEGLSLKTVAVTVSPEARDVFDIKEAGFDYVQIHGQLSGEVLEKAELPIINAFNVSDIKDFDKYKDNPKIAGFVFDAGIPGSGTAFDYELLKDLKLSDYTDKFVLLAGGLNPGNVSEALSATGLSGADTSSGVENEEKTGKSREKIFSFVKAVKA